MITPLRPTTTPALASPASSPPSTKHASHGIQRDDLPAPPPPGGDGGPDAPVHLPGEQHRRQRPRLAPPGDPRFQQCRRSDEHDRLRYPGHRRANDRSALFSARDHQPGADRRHIAARLRRHAADRAERQPGRRRRRPDDHRARMSPSAAWTSTTSARAPAFTSRAPARPAIGSTATSWAPIRPARRPSPTITASKSTRAPANNLIGTNGDGVNDAAERNVISGNSVRWRLDQRPGHGWQRRRGQLHRHDCHRGRRPGQRHRAGLRPLRTYRRRRRGDRRRRLRQPDRHRRQQRR